jgi:hypothetical protein
MRRQDRVAVLQILDLSLNEVILAYTQRQVLLRQLAR